MECTDGRENCYRFLRSCQGNSEEKVCMGYQKICGALFEGSLKANINMGDGREGRRCSGG